MVNYLLNPKASTKTESSFSCCEAFPYDLATKLIFDLSGVVCCWGDRTGPEGGKHWIFLAWLSVKETHWGPEGDASKHLPSESSCQGSHCGRTGVGGCGCTYISVPSNHQCEREENMPRSWFHFALFLTGKCFSCAPGSDLEAVSGILFNNRKAESLIWRFCYCLWMIWMTDEKKKKGKTEVSIIWRKNSLPCLLNTSLLF